MTPRTALGALHIGALLFGLTGVFGKLAAASASVIVFGRAGFAVLALAGFALLSKRTDWKKLTKRDARGLLLSGLLLAGHWVSFFCLGQDRRRCHCHTGLCQLPGVHCDS